MKTIKKIFQRANLPGKAAMTVLRIGLPVICAALLALTYKFIKDSEISAARALITYPGMYSHIFAALTLLLLGAMIFDITEKSSK